MVPSCCAVLASQLANQTFFPDQAYYKAVEASYWSTQEALLAPACIVKPANTQDVSQFISIVTGSPNCQFAIKSQGHAPAANFANIANGITLDTTGLNTTTVNADHSVAYVGPGSAWVDVYKTLVQYNKTVPGGRNGQVGAGGLTIGGGISYYSPQVGWTCDSVRNFEVVLASSKIVNANATSYPDLWRALKGGANNFGVVTRIDFDTINVVDLYAGLLFNEAQYAEQVLDAFASIAADPHYDVHASIVTSLSFNTSSMQWSVVNIPVYTKPDTHPPPYKELFSIPNITSLTSFSVQNIYTLSNEPPYPQMYQLFFTSTYAAQPAEKTRNLLRTFYQIANETLNSPSIPAGLDIGFAFEPLPHVFFQYGAGNGTDSNVLGFEKSEGNHMVLLLSPSWTDPSLKGRPQKIGEKLLAKFDAAAQKAGMGRKFQYLNYANPGQIPLRRYKIQNFEFLKKTARKYDPHGVFQLQCTGGFKLH